MKNILRKIIEKALGFVSRIIEKVFGFVKKIIESILKLAKNILEILFVIIILLLVGAGLYLLINLIQTTVSA